MGAVTSRVWTGPNWERRHLRASQPHLPSISCELSDLSFMSEVKLTIMVETFQGMQIPSLGCRWYKIHPQKIFTFSYIMVYSLTPPSHGALDVDPIKTKQRQRLGRKKESSETTASKPRELTQFENEEESTTKDVAHLFYHLKRLCGDGRRRVHYFTCLVDPESFSHSVENMFHFAFLVKVGVSLMVLYIPSLPSSLRSV